MKPSMSGDLRVAVVRGANVNPWELDNFPSNGVRLVVFGSRHGDFAEHHLELPVRRLFSPDDLVRRMSRRVWGRARAYTGDMEYLVGLQRGLRGFDIAHVAELNTPYSLQAVRARDRGYCRRVVATVWENIPFKRPENALVASRVREVVDGTDHFVAITNRAKLHLLAAGVDERRISIQPMGVNIDEFWSRGGQPREGPLKVLTVARLTPDKGIEDLLVATWILKRRGLRMPVTVVGDGHARARLERLSASLSLGALVDFRGPLEHHLLADVYRGHDIFVLASNATSEWREQFGFAVVEAMACGLPVVVGDSGSLREVVASDENLVPSRDPLALADRLQAMAVDPDRRAWHARTGRARVEQCFDRRIVARRIEAIYRSVSTQPDR